MNEMIAQVTSVLTLIIAVTAVQFKDVNYILIGQIASNLLISLSYLFLGGLSGAWICVVATLQSIIMYFANKRGITDKTRNIILACFMVAYVVGTALVYQSWADLVSCACAFLFVLGIIQKDTRIYRIFGSCNSICWIIYDLSTAAYINLITHGLLLVSIIISMLRHKDWVRQK